MTQQLLDDYEEITRLVNLYIEGANGDVAKLEEAFHPSAWMFGHIGPIETNIPITDFFKMVASNPNVAGPDYRTTISSITATGDAGTATLVEHDFMGCDFVDYFTFARIEGRWWIVNKTYAHTGGAPPAALA
jgi:hypothetical protein